MKIDGCNSSSLQNTPPMAIKRLPTSFFFKLYAFILFTSTLVPGINYFVVTTHPLHQLQVRKEE